MINAGQRIIQELTWLRNIHLRDSKLEGWFYKGPADLLLREGKMFTNGGGVTRWERSELNTCFRNAALYAMLNRMQYVEGYAVGIKPVHHAWCIDNAGMVREVTWDFLGPAYYGVQFKPALVTKGSVLFNGLQPLSIYKKALYGHRQANDDAMRSA